MEHNVKKAPLNFRRILVSTLYFLLSACLSSILNLTENTPFFILWFYLPGFFFGVALYGSWYGFTRKNYLGNLRFASIMGFGWFVCFFVGVLSAPTDKLAPIIAGCVSGGITFSISSYTLPIRSLRRAILVIISSAFALGVAFIWGETATEAIIKLLKILVGQDSKPNPTFTFVFLVWQPLAGNALTMQRRSIPFHVSSEEDKQCEPR